jgi:hypothetical protein
VAREQYPVQAWPSAVRGHRRQRPCWPLTPNAEFTRG